ncbi:MAG: leucyl aminopeptidase [Castellaniella sp.]|uniref:leucyl aminopeptidase n=1 Tax=Castellaniella sp. TaxID=1955812 RepID=UPI001211C016|nr:leucyl aminopeptidase [Castellaniella sp.]TAN30267.1 MAG: leucyl aminopeptidase [Castellaniella sp.]
MEFSTTTAGSLPLIKTPALAVGVFQDGILSPAADALDRACGGKLRAIARAEFDASPGSSLTLHALEGITADRVILLGLGRQPDYRAEALARAHQALASTCLKAGVSGAVTTLCALECPDADLTQRARLVARVVTAATYRYDTTFSTRPPAAKWRNLALHLTRTQAAQARAGLVQGAAIGAGVNLARQLGDLPANVCTPRYLGRTAKDLAREFKTLKAEVLDQKKIEALKMGSFLSVARGSAEPPVFITLRHTPSAASARKAPPIVLVGKGITFDAGGISIKPAAAMDEMKYDMCGAASVLGALRAAAELDLSREIIGIIPSCENLPSGTANKPGDIVTSLSGQTIEILNTDAEGRLILCDALTYAERFKPEAVIDMATLTGACVVALGHVNSGLFTRDEDLAARLLAAGREALDPAWRLPLEDAYQDMLKSNFADTANIGGRPAGATTAACFLSRFTGKYRWAHLDIAGTAWLQGKEKGATGRPVPLLMQYLLAQCPA